MIKLTKDQIRFIETYLENSDVFYADIRMEMTDHVASAIEKRMQLENTDDFYLVFKHYMIENKSSLLENNKMFLKHVDKSILKRLGKQFLKPATIIFFIALAVLGYQLIPLVGTKQLVRFVNWFPFLSIVPFVVIYFGSIKTFKISRFSGIERLGFVYMAFFQVLNLSQILFRNHLESNALNYLVLSVLISLTITITIILLQLTVLIINDYRNQFKHLS